MDFDVLVHVLIQHILILYTCLLISLLLWVHMYRRTCGSLTPSDCILNFLPAGRKPKIWYVFLFTIACVRAWGRLVLTTRALVRGLFRHCRVYGNILPPFSWLPHFGPVEIDYFRQIRFVSGQRDVVLVRDHLSEEFAGRILAWNALFTTSTSTTLPAICA